MNVNRVLHWLFAAIAHCQRASDRTIRMVLAAIARFETLRALALAAAP